MVWMTITILLLLWLVANLAALTLGGLVHLLIIAALGLAGLGIWRRRRSARQQSWY